MSYPHAKGIAQDPAFNLEKNMSTCSCSLGLIKCLLAHQALLPDVILHFKGPQTALLDSPRLNHRIYWLAQTASPCLQQLPAAIRIPDYPCAPRDASDREALEHMPTELSPARKDSHQKHHTSCSAASSVHLTCSESSALPAAATTMSARIVCCFSCSFGV